MLVAVVCFCGFFNLGENTEQNGQQHYWCSYACWHKCNTVIQQKTTQHTDWQHRSVVKCLLSQLRG